LLEGKEKLDVANFIPELNMNEESYIKERLDDQIDWYSKKSKRSQNWFKALRVVEIIAAAAIPFLAGYATDSEPEIKVVIGLLGVVIALVAGIISLNKFQEIWIEYRTTSETLKHHKYLFLTKAVPYSNEDSFQILVQTVEALISKENSNWNNYIKQTEKEKDDG